MAAAEAPDMLRVSHSWMYRLIATKQLETIKIGRSRHISVASIRHVAAESAAAEAVEARTERSGESVTPEESERWAICSRYDPLWTTADVAAFLSVPCRRSVTGGREAMARRAFGLESTFDFASRTCSPGWTG